MTSSVRIYWKCTLYVGLGVGTALLVRRSRDRFPVVSLGIFFHGIPRHNHVP